MCTPSRNKTIEDRGEADTQIPLTESTSSLDADDGRPRAGGHVDECGDHHTLEHHSPLFKAPLFISRFGTPAVEREQLYNVSELLQGMSLRTYVAIGPEISNVPLDALGDFLEYFALDHWTGRNLVIPSGELSNAVFSHETIPFGFLPPSHTCIDFALVSPGRFSSFSTSVLEGYPGNWKQYQLLSQTRWP